MPTRIRTTARFENNVKQLRKKYQQVRADVSQLERQLRNDERPGDKIPGVSYDVYKVRLPNKSAGRGKSGGFRVIYYIQLEDSVLLLTIYSKTDQQDISAAEIQAIINEYTE